MRPGTGRRSTKTSSSIRADVEKGRRVRRVDHLIPGERELAQEAVEVPLRLRTEVELRLLDQEQKTAEPLRAAGLDRFAEGRAPVLPGVARRLARLRARRPLAARPVSSPRPGREHGAGSLFGGEEERGRCVRGSRDGGSSGLPSSAASLPSARLTRIETSPSPPSVMSAAVERSRLGIENGADRREQVRLAGVCLTDQRA